MKKEEIISILAEWNFWGKGLDVGIKREKYVNSILQILEAKPNKIVTIFGVRRAGKSYILRQIAKTLSDKFGKNNVLYVNFEEVSIPKDFSILLKIYEGFHEIVKPTFKPFLLLDEIQEINGWEKFVRSLNEKNEAKIVVSGSSAKLMSEEFATLLSGRDIPIEVFPLTFKEFLQFKGFEPKQYLFHKREIISFLREYLEFGGFPEVVLEENKKIKDQILRRYVETILLKDVAKRFRIREINKLEFLASFYLTNISSLINFNKIANILKIPVKTVERYSKYMSTSRMIFFISKFSFRVKEKELSPRKIYVIDVGISRFGLKFSENIGRLMENVVGINLISKFKEPFSGIYYWKDYQQREVDFVVKEGLRIKQLIQVTYASSKDEIEKREIKALIRAFEMFKKDKPELLIITWDYEDEIIVNNLKINCIPLWKWLLELDK